MGATNAKGKAKATIQPQQALAAGIQKRLASAGESNMLAGLKNAAAPSETGNTALKQQSLLPTKNIKNPSSEVVVKNAAPKGIGGALVDLNSDFVEAKKHLEILERDIALASAVDKLQRRSEV